MLYMVTSNFFFASLAFLISILSGVYFLRLYFSSGKKHTFLLYWAFGLGATLWFKIPSIIVNTHIQIVQPSLYTFFYVTLLVYFLAYFALIRGLMPFRGFSHKKLFYVFASLGIASSAFYFYFTFFVHGFDITYTPVWAGHLLFFIPVQLLLLFRLFRIMQWSLYSSKISKVGILLTAFGTVTLSITSFLYMLVQTESVQRSFWYYSVATSSSISILQIVSGLLFFFGFRALALTYLSSIHK